MSRGPAWILGLVLTAALLLSRSGVAAQTVVLVMAGGSQQELAPVEQQLRSELLAGGFAVTAVQVPNLPDSASLQETASGMVTKAAIAVILSDTAISGFVWATAQDGERTLVRPIQPVAVSDDAASVFAIRAAELLNAVLIELGWPKRRPPDAPAEPEPEPKPAPPPPEPKPAPPPPEPKPAPPPRAAPTPEPAAWSFWGGAGVVGGPGGIPAGPALVLGVSRRLGYGFWTQAMLAGPVFGWVDDSTGEARVDQELGALRLSWQIRPTPWLGTYVVAGIGGHRLGVTGEALPPHEGQDDEVWSVLGLAGAGLRLDLGRSFALLGEGDLGLTTPRAKVVFVRRAAARAARPLLLGAAAIEYAW